MSILLDSADQIARTSDPLDYNSMYTIAFWFMLTGTIPADFKTLCSVNENVENDARDNLRILNSTTVFQLILACDDGTTQTNATGTTISSNTWYHMAVVRASTTSCLMYLDGVLDITNSGDMAGRSSFPAVRMDWGAYGAGAFQKCPGRWAHIKAWSTNLSASEIQTEMRFRRAKRRTNLHGEWLTLPGTTERLKDRSGNARDLSGTGTPTDADDPTRVWWGDKPGFIPPSLAVAGAATHPGWITSSGGWF